VINNTLSVLGGEGGGARGWTRCDISGEEGKVVGKGGREGEKGGMWRRGCK